MASLKQIQTDSNWGVEAPRINDNFNAVNAELAQLRGTTSVNLPLFTSVAQAKENILNPSVGRLVLISPDYSIPAPVYRWDGNNWVDTGKTGGNASVSLENFYTKEEIDQQNEETEAQFKEQDKKFNELNISALYPTNGVDGTNKYDLAGAIAQVPAEYRNIQGLKVSFVNESGDTETWEYKGTTWVVGSFSEVGAKKFSELSKEDMALAQKNIEKKCSKNLFDKNRIFSFKYLNSSGIIADNPNEKYKVSDYIPIKNGQTLVMNIRVTSGGNSALFKEVGDIECISGTLQSANITTITNNTGYDCFAVFQINQINADELQIEVGDVSTEYEEYLPLHGYTEEDIQFSKKPIMAKAVYNLKNLIEQKIVYPNLIEDANFNDDFAVLFDITNSRTDSTVEVDIIYDQDLQANCLSVNPREGKTGYSLTAGIKLNYLKDKILDGKYILFGAYVKYEDDSESITLSNLEVRINGIATNGWLARGDVESKSWQWLTGKCLVNKAYLNEDMSISAYIQFPSEQMSLLPTIYISKPYIAIYDRLEDIPDNVTYIPPLGDLVYMYKNNMMRTMYAKNMRITNHDNDFQFDKLFSWLNISSCYGLFPNFNIPITKEYGILSTDIFNIDSLNDESTDEQWIKAKSPNFFFNGERRGCMVLFDGEGEPYIINQIGEKKYLTLK